LSKKERVALITDLHFGVFQNNKVFFEYQMQYFEQVFFKYLIEHEIEKVIILGDVNDNRTTVNNFIASEIEKRFIGFFKRNNIYVDIIIGNHDKFYKDVNTHTSLDSYESDYIHIVKEPEKIVCNGKNLLYHPHGTKSEDFIKEKGIFFGHASFIGGNMGCGHTCDKGFEMSTVKKYERSYIGHFHTPNGMYIGAPYQQSFKSYDEHNRGFIVTDFHDYEERIINNFSPKFIKVTYDSSEENFINIAGLKNKFEINDYDVALKLIGNNYVQLIIKNISDLIAFETFEQKIKHIYNRLNLSILSEHFSIDGMKQENIKDTYELFNEYFKTQADIPSVLDFNIAKEKFIEKYADVKTNAERLALVMSKITFKKIRFKNFISYGDEWTEFVFVNGMYRVIGKNGAGKTSLTIEAINFLLFGTSILKKKKDKLRNRFTKLDKKKLKVEGDITIGDDEYTIKRGLDNSEFEIIKNGVKIEKPAKGYQQILNDALGLSPKQLQVMILKNKKIYKAFSTMSAEEKRTFIDRMFNIEIFAEILKIVKQEIKDQKQDLIVIDKDVDKYNTLLEQEEEHLQEIENKFYENILELQDAEREKIKAIDNDKHLSLLRKNKIDLQEEIEELEEEEIIVDEKPLQILNRNQTKIKQDLKDFESQDVTKEINDTIEELNEDITDLKETKDDKIGKIKDKFLKLKKEIVKINEAKSMTCSLEQKVRVMDSKKNKKIELQKEIISYNEEKVKYNDEILKCETIIKTATERFEKMKEICEDCPRIEIIKKSMNILNDEQRILKYKELLNICKKKLQKSEKNLIENSEEIILLQERIDYVNDLNNSEITDKSEMKDLKFEKERLQELYKDRITKKESRIKVNEESRVKRLKELDIRLKGLNYGLVQNIDEIANLKNENALKLKQLTSAKDKKLIDLKEELSDIKEEIKNIRIEHKEKIEKLNSKLDELEELQHKPDLTKKKKYVKIRNLEKKKYNEKHLENMYSEYLKTMLTSEDSVKSYIIDQYLSYINLQFNTYLSRYNKPFALIFDKNMNFKIAGSCYDDLDYENFSSGEEKAIDLSLIFTFNDLQEKLFNRTINILTFDEILSGLSQTNATVTFDILKEKSQDKTIFVIEHLIEDTNVFDKTYEVKKVNKFSKIVEVE